MWPPPPPKNQQKTKQKQKEKNPTKTKNKNPTNQSNKQLKYVRKETRIRDINNVTYVSARIKLFSNF